MSSYKEWNFVEAITGTYFAFRAVRWRTMYCNMEPKYQENKTEEQWHFGRMAMYKR
jgi:hypothetical protein